MIESISCSKILSKSLGKSKQNVFGSVVIMSLTYSMCAHIIITTWLNCCKLFWWCAKDIIFVYFRFLVWANYFQLLFMLIILKIWLIVCLELRFWILFLFLFFLRGFNFSFQQKFLPALLLLLHHLLVVTLVVNYLDLSINQELSFQVYLKSFSFSSEFIILSYIYI